MQSLNDEDLISILIFNFFNLDSTKKEKLSTSIPFTTTTTTHGIAIAFAIFI